MPTDMYNALSSCVASGNTLMTQNNSEKKLKQNALCLHTIYTEQEGNIDTASTMNARYFD